MLAAICDRHPRGQLLCAQSGLLQVGVALSVRHSGAHAVVFCGAVDLFGGSLLAAAARCCAGVRNVAQHTNGIDTHAHRHSFSTFSQVCMSQLPAALAALASAADAEYAAGGEPGSGSAKRCAGLWAGRLLVTTSSGCAVLCQACCACSCEVRLE